METSAALRVTVVSVTYHSMAVLPDMLASLPKETPTIIVDNAPGPDEGLAALCAAHDAKLIRNPVNTGFGAACNVGAAAATTEFLLFLNPDATLLPDTLDQLVAAAARYPKASAMNPRIADTDGAPAFHRSSRLMPRRERMARGWPAADCDVTVLSGAALFVRTAEFNAVGGFDPRIFLYHEDDDLSRRLRAERGPIMFIRDALVLHRCGESSPRDAEMSALKGYHQARSRVYATRKHGRPLPFAAALFSAVKALFALDMIWSPRRRAKNLAVLKGVLSTWRDGGASQVAK